MTLRVERQRISIVSQRTRVIVDYIPRLLANWTDQLALEFDYAALQVWFDEGRTGQLKKILSSIASELEWHENQYREHLRSEINV